MTFFSVVAHVAMVFFTCNACGASLKKNQVEKHYRNECRSCSVLSCMDCGQDFYGDEYAGHTKCISEAEKYQGNMYKGSSCKGEQKQEAWLEVWFITHQLSVIWWLSILFICRKLSKLFRAQRSSPRLRLCCRRLWSILTYPERKRSLK